VDEARARELLGDEVERVKRVIGDVKHDIGDESENESIGELSDDSQHPADTGTETFEREKDLSILDSLERELRELEVALGRVDEGSYGTCEACGEAIPEARLEAQPAARFCTEHVPSR